MVLSEQREEGGGGTLQYISGTSLKERLLK